MVSDAVMGLIPSRKREVFRDAICKLQTLEPDEQDLAIIKLLTDLTPRDVKYGETVFTVQINESKPKHFKRALVKSKYIKG